MKATTPRTTSTPSGGSPTHGVSEPASAPTLSAATGEQPAPARPRRRGFTPGSGILRDIRARAPFYKSDWTDGEFPCTLAPRETLEERYSLELPSHSGYMLDLLRKVSMHAPRAARTLTLAQRPPWHCILTRPHRTDRPIRRRRSSTLILHSRRRLRLLRGPTAVYRRRDGYAASYA
jgi:hypothetical protein